MSLVSISGSRFDPVNFAGAPLDVIKLVAALLMIVDHVNAVFLGNHPTLWWHLGRMVFPLFGFALVCNLQRGSSVGKYLTMLLVLGAVSQPIFAATFGESDGNTLFTLAVGIAVTAMLRERSLPVQHAVLAAGVLAVFLPFVKARTGLDFGLAGMLFPAALYLVLNGGLSHAPWLILLLVGLNWFQPDPWRFAPVTTAAIAAAGVVVMLLIALLFKNRPRFLPRYALHAFYPGHLLLLGAANALWRG